MKSYIKVATLIAAIIILYGLAGEADYQEAVAQQERYCAAVEAGRWPDYQGNYDEVCR